MVGQIWHILADPWTSSIVARALFDMCLLGITAGTLGCWVVFYDLSYATESLAHGLFPGLVAAALLGLPLLLGGAIGLGVAVLAIALASRIPGIERSTAIAVVISTLFATGVVLGLAQASPPGLATLLFGDLLGVSGSDIVLASALAVVVVVSLRVLHGRLLAVGFDRANAQAFGAKPLVADIAVMTLLAAAMLVAVQALGSLLVVALLVGPAAAARLVTRRMLPMMLVAVVLAIGASIAGLYLSFYAETAGGASVAGTIVGLYLATLCWASLRSLGRVKSRQGAARRSAPT